MPRLTPLPLTVTDKDREELEAIIRKRTSPQQMVIRARIILYAGHKSVHGIARHLNIGRTTVQIWQRRWRETASGSVHERLADLPRSGAPAQFTPEQICAVIAMACECPEDSDRPISQWSQQEIADEAVKRGLVESISQRTIGRFFKRCRPETPSHAPMAHPKAR